MDRTCVVVFATILNLTGCATQYGSSGFTGGYSEKRLNDRLLKVDFSGNSYITADKVQMYALYRCAELARDAKKPYFLLYDSLTAAARGIPASQPRAGMLGTKPAAFALMALEDVARPGAQEVSVVLARLGPLVHAGHDSGGK